MSEKTFAQALGEMVQAIEQQHDPVEYVAVCHFDEPDSPESKHPPILEEARS